MQISDLVAWFTNPDNFGTVLSVGVTLLALILGLVIGGVIVSSQSRKQQRTADELAKSNVVADALDATIDIAAWSSLSPAAQAQVDRTIARVDVRLRVLPVQGAGAIADWTGHQLAELKRVSGVGGGAAAQTTLDLFRDRLVLFIYNPKRASKLCERDLERWAFVTGPTNDGLTSGPSRRSAAKSEDEIPQAPVTPANDLPPAFAPPASTPTTPAATPSVPPVPATTSTIPAAAAAHAQAASNQPKDPFEDLLGPDNQRR